MGGHGLRRNTNSPAQRTMKPPETSPGSTVPAFTREDTRSTIDITPTTGTTPKDQNGTRKGASWKEARVVKEKGHVVISLPDSEKTTQYKGKKGRQKKVGGRKDQEGINNDGSDDNHEHTSDKDDDHHHEEEEKEGEDHEHPSELCETSRQHSAYIEAHLEELQKKCNEFHECTIELYNAENFHRVLAGEPLQLSNICGLMYPEGEEEFTTGNQSVKCSMSERDAIREDIGRRLTREMADKRKTDETWKSLNFCVEKNAHTSESTVDTVCRLTGTQTSLCDNPEVHKETEHFFNHEMEHLHCSCAAIRAQAQKPQEGSLLPKEVRVAIGSGVVGLFVILVIVIVILCIRHKKVKKRLSQHRMKYLPSPHDEGSAIYQEINDRPQNGKNEGSVPGGYHFLGRAPSLPERYVKPGISRSRDNLHTPGEEEREYLEPLPDVGPGGKGKPTAALANMGYGTPGTLGVREAPYDLARHPPGTSPRSPENDYFDRLQLRNAAEEDGGTPRWAAGLVLQQMSRTEGKGRESDRGQYFVLEPEDDVTSEKDGLSAVTAM